MHQVGPQVLSHAPHVHLQLHGRRTSSRGGPFRSQQGGGVRSAVAVCACKPAARWQSRRVKHHRAHLGRSAWRPQPHRQRQLARLIPRQSKLLHRPRVNAACTRPGMQQRPRPARSALFPSCAHAPAPLRCVPRKRALAVPTRGRSGSAVRRRPRRPPHGCTCRPPPPPAAPAMPRKPLCLFMSASASSALSPRSLIKKGTMAGSMSPAGPARQVCVYVVVVVVGWGGVGVEGASGRQPCGKPW